MLDASTCCRCSSGRQAVRYVVLLWSCLALLAGTSAELGYEEMLERLKNTVRDNFDGPPRQDTLQHLTGDIKVMSCVAGRICKRDLTKMFGNHQPLFQVVEGGKNSLPDWVFMKNDKIIAVPLRGDVGTYKLALSGLGKEAVLLEIRVVLPKDPLFHCDLPSSEVIVGSIILNADASRLRAIDRLELLRKMSNVVNIDMHRAVLLEGRSITNKELMGAAVLSAGPGDMLVSDTPGVTFMWRARCGVDVAGERTIHTMKSGAADGSIKNAVGYAVVGWFVTSQGQRARRQVTSPKGTPLPTLGPTQPKATRIVSMGTPALSVTPSVSPMTTVVVMKTTTPPMKSMSTATESTSSLQMQSSSAIAPSPSTSRMVSSSVPLTTPEPIPTTDDTTTMPTTTNTPVTTQPVTSEPETSEQPTTVMPTKTVLPVTPGNSRPILINPVGDQIVYVNQLFYYSIHDDMFFDSEDGNTSSLAVWVMTDVGRHFVNLTDSHWLRYDATKRIIYALPDKNMIGSHRFVVRASDPSGASSDDVFTVTVKQDVIKHNNIFNITLDSDFDQFNSSLWNAVELLRKIADVTKASYHSLRQGGVRRGSVIFSWSSEQVEQKDCNSAEADIYYNAISGGQFKDSMAPEYIVVDTGMYQKQPCFVAGGGVRGGAGWWSKIIIPIIVVIIVLLLIALICCCVYRRKNKYSPQREDTNGYLYNKKPVIFREEFEEKPDLVCLEPLILPNEKPPISTPSYAPRTSTPDGAASSTISTESDEKPPLTSSSHSSKDTPRKPPGRSPPPYSH